MEAQAALTFAREEDVRAQDLVKKGAGTQQRAQQTASDLRQRQAAFERGRSQSGGNAKADRGFRDAA
jgi:membrane fusion protein (multidrug efflux system)